MTQPQRPAIGRHVKADWPCDRCGRSPETHLSLGEQLFASGQARSDCPHCHLTATERPAK